MIVNHILELYLVLFITVIVHELAHAFTAKMIGLDVREFKIGDDLFAVKLGRVSISLNTIFGSNVSVYSEELKTKNKMQIIIFFMSGSLANLLLIVLSVLCNNVNPLYANALLWCNVYTLIGGICPIILKQNDMNKMLFYIRNIEK